MKKPSGKIDPKATKAVKGMLSKLGRPIGTPVNIGSSKPFEKRKGK